MQSMNLMNPKQDMPDLSEMVTNFFGGGSSAPKKKDKAIKGKKKWKEEEFNIGIICWGFLRM